MAGTGTGTVDWLGTYPTINNIMVREGRKNLRTHLKIIHFKSYSALSHFHIPYT